MNTGVLELSEQERIARYLHKEHVRPTFVIEREGRVFPLEGFKDLFLYDNATQRGFLPVNGYYFPVEAILGVHEGKSETLLNVNFSRATRQ